MPTHKLEMWKEFCHSETFFSVHWVECSTMLIYLQCATQNQQNVPTDFYSIVTHLKKAPATPTDKLKRQSSQERAKY